MKRMENQDIFEGDSVLFTPSTAKYVQHRNRGKKFNFELGDAQVNLVDVSHQSETFPSTSNAKNDFFYNSSISTTHQPQNYTNKKFNLSMGFNETNAHLLDVAQHSELFSSTSNASYTANEKSKHTYKKPKLSVSERNSLLIDEHAYTYKATNTILNNSATSITTEGTSPTSSENIMSMLQKILQKQIDLESRITKIEEMLPELAEVMVQYKVMRDSKVLIKKTHKIVCRISGETENDIHTELSTLTPLESLDAVYDIEQKLNSDDYQESMKSYIFMQKGASSDLNGVMRKLFSDDVLYYFNWHGICNKRAFSKLKLVNAVLFDVFKLQGKLEFEGTIKKGLTKSHSRQKQRRYLKNKASTASTLSTHINKDL